MWTEHCWRFLGRVWIQVLSWHSATTFSIIREIIVVPVLLLLVSLWLPIRKERWWKWETIRTLRKRGADVLRNFLLLVCVLFGLLGLVFVAAIPFVVYEDHKDLVAQVGRLGKALAQSEQNASSKFEHIIRSKDSEIQKLKTDFASKEGACGALRQQLNTLLVQQKEVPTIKTFPVSHDMRPGVPRMEYILVTNVVRTPVTITSTCDIPIADGSLFPMTETGGSMSVVDHRRISATQFRFSVESPAWSPSGPLWITVFFNPPVKAMPSCSFSVD
jgi:nitrate reductase NapE component